MVVGVFLLLGHVGHQRGERDRRQVQAVGLLEPDAGGQRFVRTLERAGLGHPLVLGQLHHQVVLECGEVVRDFLRAEQLGQTPHVGGFFGARRTGHQPHPICRAHQAGERLVALGLRVTHGSGFVVQPEVDVGALLQLSLDHLEPVVVDDVEVHVLLQQLEPAFFAADQHGATATAEEVHPYLVFPHARQCGLGADDDGLVDDAVLHQVVRGPHGALGLARTHVRQVDAAVVQREELGANPLMFKGFRVSYAGHPQRPVVEVADRAGRFDAHVAQHPRFVQAELHLGVVDAVDGHHTGAGDKRGDTARVAQLEDERLARWVNFHVSLLLRRR